MKITESVTESRPTEVDIKKFEEMLGSSLPSDYKSFLQAVNGGRPEQAQFKENSVQYFFALYEGRVGSLKRKYDTYRQRIPQGFLPIATDSFGNLIVLKIDGDEYGKIYFWDHEKEDEDSPTMENMICVGSSFSEFVASLEK